MNRASGLREMLTNPPDLIQPSRTGFYPIIYGGPPSIGKTVRADAQIRIYPNSYQYGPKGKLREKGTTKLGDNERPDSILFNRLMAEQARRQGNVLAEYFSGNTVYLVLREGSLPGSPEITYTCTPDTMHKIYVALTHDGAMKTGIGLLEHSPIPVFFYLRMSKLRQRLEESKTSEQERISRLQTYSQDAAQFLLMPEGYAVLWHVREPFLSDKLYLNDTARIQAQAEIDSDAQGIHRVVNKFIGLLRKPMTYTQVHQAFIDEKVRNLFGTDLEDLRRLLKDGPVKLDLSSQVDAFLKSGRYLTGLQREALSKVEAVRLVNHNERDTLFFRGMEQGPFENGYVPAEDYALDFIVRMACEPGEQLPQLQSTKNQIANNQSTLGLVKIPYGAKMKEGGTFALGHTHL